MLHPFWAEYARIQQLVEQGKARDGQLDRLLDQRATDDNPFDLHDSRRRLKNFDRNSLRKERLRSTLLRRHSHHFDRPTVEPPITASRNERADTVRRATCEQWELLYDTLDGDYATVASARGMAVGTLKSQVSRAKAALKLALRRFDSDEE